MTPCRLPRDTQITTKRATVASTHRQSLSSLVPWPGSVEDLLLLPSSIDRRAFSPTRSDVALHQCRPQDPASSSSTSTDISCHHRLPPLQLLLPPPLVDLRPMSSRPRTHSTARSEVVQRLCSRDFHLTHEHVGDEDPDVDAAR